MILLIGIGVNLGDELKYHLGDKDGIYDYCTPDHVVGDIVY
jgi:hypothetical protein